MLFFLLKIVENVERILAIELFNAAQALEFRRPLKSSDFIQMFVKEVEQTYTSRNTGYIIGKMTLDKIKMISKNATLNTAITIGQLSS